jgi:hypothetical protein
MVQRFLLLYDDWLNDFKGESRVWIIFTLWEYERKGNRILILAVFKNFFIYYITCTHTHTDVYVVHVLDKTAVKF